MLNRPTARWDWVALVSYCPDGRATADNPNRANGAAAGRAPVVRRLIAYRRRRRPNHAAVVAAAGDDDGDGAAATADDDSEPGDDPDSLVGDGSPWDRAFHAFRDSPSYRSRASCLAGEPRGAASDVAVADAALDGDDDAALVTATRPNPRLVPRHCCATVGLATNDMPPLYN